MSRAVVAFAALSLFAAGCGCSAAPTQTASPARAEPTPTVAPPAEPAPVARCSGEGAVVYRESATSLNVDPRSDDITAEVRQDGSWRIGDDSGCLDRAHVAELVDRIGATSFMLPEQPLLHCLAVPTTLIRIEAPLHGSEARWATPCGATPSPEVVSLSQWVHRTTGGST